jgi:hypothetical protein
MQQQQTNFDLLAVFPEENKAEAAEAKLRKEGFGDEEVFRLAAGAVGQGEFREHGPARDRSAVFLQTTRRGPRPLLVVLFAIIFGVVLGGLTFGVVDISLKSIALFPATWIGLLVGIVLGVIFGLTRRGRVRGAIGQNIAQGKLAETSNKRPDASALTVVAVRLPDPENISRKSKARAILLNNGGKIDRSIGV